MAASFRLSEPSPAVIKKANEIVSLAGAKSPREKGLALFLFVRDSIKFGFTRKFDSASPEETLCSGMGHCNPQGALFASLLQAEGIQAQQHFVELSPGVLRGILFPPPPRLVHSYVELQLPMETSGEPGGDSMKDKVDNRRIRVDGYIADKTLFEAARAKLLAEEQMEGFGVHVQGSIEWDGKSDCFCQMADETQQVTCDLGTFDKPNDFYSSPANFQRIPWTVRLVIGLVAINVNSSINAVRAEVRCPPEKRTESIS